MSAIKKFFEKRKLSLKFKKAGEGHYLHDSTSHFHQATSGSPSHFHQARSGTYPRLSGSDPEAEAARRAAAEAAMARMEEKLQMKQEDSMFLQRTRMKREMEAEKKQLNEEARGATARAESVEEAEDSSPELETVLFRCPGICTKVLTKSEMESYIHKFLLDNYEDEPELTSAVMIHTLNKNKEKVKVCVETLAKYLDNIINNPTEEKYWKIRLCNKAFQERVACMKGTEEFLLAAGFSLRFFPFEDDEARFYVLEPELAKNVERLHYIKEVLVHSEPLRPVLDRDLKVFYPSDSDTTFDVPEDFFVLSHTEIKREQNQQEQALGKHEIDENAKQGELRKYRYTLIRIKFPDGILLQGVFKATENMKQVYQFVKENLQNDSIPFQLSTAVGNRLDKCDDTLAELGLAPAALIKFAWDAEALQEATEQKGEEITKKHLKSRVMALLRKL